MATKHNIERKKPKQPVPLSTLNPSDAFIAHNVLFPEMNTVAGVLASDSDEVYTLTNTSKDAKEVIGVEKFLLVYGLKSGHVKHVLPTTLVHKVDIEFGYYIPE